LPAGRVQGDLACMPRPTWTALGAVLLAACATSDLPESLPHLEELPADAVFIYQFDPNLLTYEFVDTTVNGPVRLSWLAPSPQTPFTGYTCFGLTPRVPGDSVGRFVFIARGLNTGYLERHTTAGLDSTIGYFLAGPEGSRGTYVRHMSGDLDLLWSNGQQVRYFDATATIRIQGNLLSSDVTLRASGDSVSVTWGVGWVEGPC